MIHNVKLHSHMAVGRLQEEFGWTKEQVLELREAGRVRNDSVVFEYDAPQALGTVPVYKPGQDWADHGDVRKMKQVSSAQELIDDVKYILDKNMIPCDELCSAINNGMRLYRNGLAAGKPKKVGSKAAAAEQEAKRTAFVAKLTPEQFGQAQSHPGGFFKWIDEQLAKTA